MNPKVTATMCGLSVVVVAMALRASERQSTTVVAGVAHAGIVVTSPSTATRARATARAKTRHHTSKAALGAPTPTSVAPRHSSAPTRTSSPAAKPPTTTTVNGQAIDTQYGPVQVQIVIRNRQIVQANAIEYPQDTNRDQEINGYAIPQLNQETLQAQSSQIDSVSGATYTSEGYINSLQSAIDQAHAAGVF